MKAIKKILLRLLSVFTLTVLMGILPGCASRSSEELGPKYVAHKGYHRDHFENTEKAFQAAAKMGFYGIETDIRKTKDGHFVCHHDAEVTFENGEKALISKTTLDALLSKPLKNDQTNDAEYLCTFKNYLRACKEGNKVAVIELKDHFDVSVFRNILRIVNAVYDRKKITFISFSYDCLMNAKKASSDVPLQYLSQTKNDTQFASCLENGISIDVKEDILTDELIETFHAAGLTVNVWTVNDESVLERVIEQGVDYITTDKFHKE